MCDAWQGDGVIVAGAQRDERINGSCGLMEGGSATRSLPSGASCSRAERNLFGWWAEPFFMFWMPPRSFLPATAGMIWMSPARVMFLKHDGPSTWIDHCHSAHSLCALLPLQSCCRLCRCWTWRLVAEANKQLLFTNFCLYLLAIRRRNPSRECIDSLAVNSNTWWSVILTPYFHSISGRLWRD